MATTLAGGTPIAVATSSTGVRRTFAPLSGNDQWLRCSHHATALDRDTEVVTLASPVDPAATWPTDVPAPPPAGLAFDRRGCLYHGVPERGQLRRVAWRPDETAEPVDLLSDAPVVGGGEFTPVGTVPGTVPSAVALAADLDDHLFVLDGVRGLVFVLDLADGRVVRTVDPSVPVVDLAADGDVVLLASVDRATPLLSLTAFGLVLPVTLDARARASLGAVPSAARPTRIAVGPGGERWLLLRDGTSAWAVPVGDSRRSLPIAVDGATDLELDGSGRLVIAGPPGADLQRFTVGEDVDTSDVGLRARHTDGRGIARTPDGGIGYWRADRDAFRLAIEARRRYVREGWLDCHRIDGGAYQQRFGRVFVEACVPTGSTLRVSFVTSDDDPDPQEPGGSSIPRELPANVLRDASELPPATPPLVPVGREPELTNGHALHRRETGPELPWSPVGATDRFEVYEAPVAAPHGRYLWLRLHLSGTTAVAPRVRAIRVEIPGHDLLDRLPATYRRDPVAAEFLQRYLALVDGLLVEVEARAARRDLLLDPFGAPAEMLPWLASLVALTLDRRWSDRARRTMIAESICLFRRRGTIGALRRMLQIVLDECDVVIVETFRFRGTGGAFAGDEGTAASVVGVDLRVGGQVGESDARPLEERRASASGVSPRAASATKTEGTTDDAYRTHAHRFTVLVPMDLDDERDAMVRHLLELHRPAHTLVDLCTVGRGMRIGVGLHVALTTLVGPSAGFSRAVLGETRLGTNAVVGNPRAGVRPGGSRLDDGLVIDP